MHTSSPSLYVIACTMAILMAMNSSDSGINQVLSAHLDSLAISPQTKQVIIPALLGIARFGDVHTQTQRYVHTICRYSFCLCILINHLILVLLSSRMPSSHKVQVHTLASSVLSSLGEPSQPMLVIKCTGNHMALTLGVATPSGTFPGLIQVFNHLPWSPNLNQSIYTLILIQLWRPISIGCLLVVVNGKVSPKVQNIPTTMAGSFSFMAMGNQAGSCEHQSARQRHKGWGGQHQLCNFLTVGVPCTHKELEVCILVHLLRCFKRICLEKADNAKKMTMYHHVHVPELRNTQQWMHDTRLIVHIYIYAIYPLPSQSSLTTRYWGRLSI